MVVQKAIDINDAASGALLGACVGDAAGATLEFIRRKPTPQEVDWAMWMPGGGIMNVASGQITDDGELTLCLAHALSNSRYYPKPQFWSYRYWNDRWFRIMSSSYFPREQIAKNYVAWILSNPFDVGNTTAQAFATVLRVDDWQTKYQTDSLAQAVSEAATASYSSKANGSLMRATPLGIWGHQLIPEVLADYARQDSALSHPNASCCDAVACYTIAIASLLRFPGKRMQAFDTALQWALTNANDEVKQWLDLAQTRQDVPYYPHVGFIKIAFVHAFRQLLIGSTYQEAIYETLCGGGDTDTNACIVGGLIGAACGANAIPDGMKQPVLSCNTTHGGQPRPNWLHTTQLPKLVKQLVKIGWSIK
ncbi:hypothetical protein TI05_04705 [Achromatium sp. WMS3]|nr:hypothetical protein TI05_04705 [Achromatium sp. WMS3]